MAYTSGNTVQSALSENWDNTAGTWANFSKESYTYDGAGKLLGTLTQNWDSAGGVWQNASEEIYTYDGSNNQATKLLKNWNTVTGVWENYSYETFTHDSFAHLTSDLFQTWDITSNAWGNIANFQYSGFSGDLPGVKIVQHWDGIGMVFVNSYKSQTTYNTSSLPVYWLEQIWNETSGAWNTFPNNAAMRYYYQTYVSEVKGITSPQGRAAFYPVPCNTALNIAVEWNKEQDFTMTILDAAGREYYSKKIAKCKKYEETVSTGNFPAGVYMANIEGAEGRIVKQVVIER